jgi:hypothetical protein
MSSGSASAMTAWLALASIPRTSYFLVSAFRPAAVRTSGMSTVGIR